MTEPNLHSELSWYAIHTRSNHEKRVAEALRARDIECYLPTSECLSQWKDRRVRLERPLFTGYVFAHIVASERPKVVVVPSVVNVLCDRNSDAIADEYIDCLRKGLHERHAEAHPYLTVGNSVEIIAGPFNGLQGILIEHKNTHRVVISIPSIMRAFVIEVGLDEVRNKVRVSGTTRLRGSTQVA